MDLSRVSPASVQVTPPATAASAPSALQTQALNSLALPQLRQAAGPGGAPSLAPRSTLPLPALAGSSSAAGPSHTSAALLDAQQKQLLAKASGVWVLAYSSTGGGHTARCLEPMMELVRRGRIARNDDVVCIMMPEHWPHDKGAAKRTLEGYLGALKHGGIHCILVQTDKTITGLYTPSGSSDNSGILADFARKPLRDVPTPQVRSIYPGGPATGHAANEAMRQLVEAAGDGGKFHVLSDMGVYTTKAARLAGIPPDHIVEMGNHALLLDPSVNHRGRALGILSKVTAADHAGRLGLVSYDERTNTLARMRSTLSQLGIIGSDPAVAVRERVMKDFLQYGHRIPLSLDAPATAGILVADGATAKDIDGAVYFYVNEYTQAAANMVRERLQSQDPDFSKTMFVICGPGTFGDDRSKNALHMLYAAQADGVMNAGFGTTSEVHYLLRKGFQGQVLLLPVEDQHEQQANAEMMQSLLGERITIAHTPGDLSRQLDQLVRSRTRTGALEGDMSSIVEAVENPHTFTHHIAALMMGGDMTAQETALLQRGREIAQAPDTKAMRRGAKLVVTVLQGLMAGAQEFQVRMTAKQAATQHGLGELAQRLRSPAECAELFGQVDATGPQTDAFRRQWAQRFERLEQLPPADRGKQAARWLAELGDAYVLGF
jgi:hypothetical protein